MTLFLTMLVVVLLVIIAVLVWRGIQADKDHDRLSDKYYDADLERFNLRTDKTKLEQEITVLRTSNRDSLKVWQSERRRLWAQARDAERHAQEMQAFHLYNEQDLQHELAGAHALIELLMMAIPKGEVLTQKYEVQRLFRSVALVAPKINTPGNTKYPDAPGIF